MGDGQPPFQELVEAPRPLLARIMGLFPDHTPGQKSKNIGERVRLGSISHLEATITNVF